MSTYPSCKHDFSDPMGVCPLCEQENKIESLERQLAEARAEVDRLRKSVGEWCKTAEMYRRFETEARKEVAREIIQYIEDQGKVSFGSIMNRDTVCDIDDRDITELKKRFGLEG